MAYFKKTLEIKKYTLEYFSDFIHIGDYIPNMDRLINTLNKYGLYIKDILGSGDSGIAYLLSNGDVLKITSNNKEAKISMFFKNNKSKHVIEYKSIWKEGDLYFIIMERINKMAIEDPIISNSIKLIKKEMHINNCHSLSRIYDLVNRLNTIPKLIQSQILSYLNNLKKSKLLDVFDILNIDNIGIRDGQLIFFDIN